MAFVFVAINIFVVVVLLLRMMIRCVESISTGCSEVETLVRDQRRTTRLGFPSQDPENTSLSGFHDQICTVALILNKAVF